MSVDSVRRRTAPPGQRRPRRWPVLLAAGALLPLPLLVGCETDGAGAGVPAVPQDLAATPRGLVRDGGTARWAIDAMPGTFNTFQTDGDAAGDRIAEAVLPALFTLDRHGRPERNEDYLAGATVVRREPRQVVVYRLNPKATWNDGRAIGAADFTAQWKALSGRNPAFGSAHNAGYDRIEKVERGEGDHEVRVTFKKTYGDWRALFTPLYPKSVMSSPEAFNDGSRTRLAASAGPFRIKARDPRAGTVTLARDRNWWGERAKLDELVLQAVPAGRREEALKAQRIDLAEVAGPAARRIGAAAAQTSGRKSELRDYQLRKSLAPGYTQLALNGADGPLADQRVRRAVARAIDRRQIASAALKPYGLPARPLGNHLRVVGQQGYQDNSGVLGRHDTDAARALLSDAGWHQGRGTVEADGEGREDSRSGTDPERSDGGRPGPARADTAQGRSEYDRRPLTKAGDPLALRFVLPSSPGTEPLRSVARQISEMLSAVGIRTELEQVDDGSYLRDRIAGGDYDLALYSWPATPFPATDARAIYGKPEAGADGSLLVGQNYTRVGTDRIDQLFEEAAGQLDEGAAGDLMRRADARIWAVAGSIPLYQRPQLVVARKSLVNAGAFGYATPRYQDIGFRK
ncbi:ABC transporter family substrate-binding protein [Streptomyces sp. TP-A0874]|uniref:ABC transporter family substrate-binding protein n=1 Tax=Streptomyces sp. TP-A0874 TaxID=549819 RepID=UPI0009A08DDF|nr:ABC transporter family substrate-binding protein [Streptomyces sp. TP-A0874]